MIPVKLEKKEDGFSAALHHLAEYPGVKAAAVFSHDGLVVSQHVQDCFDAQAFGALVLAMLNEINRIIKRLGHSPALRLSIRTADSWIVLLKVEDLILAVQAGHQTDDLLRLRLAQAAEMVKAYVHERYPLLAK